jgi:SMC interacting uncharacterized protein involved in chromosome segregation
MSLAWDEIMSKCPTMKKLIEDKITEEISKKDAEISALTARVDELKAQISGGGGQEE